MAINPMAISTSYANALNQAKKVQPKTVIQKPVAEVVSPEQALRQSQGSAQDWLNNPKSGVVGGYQGYVQKQNERYATADQPTRDLLTADANRVGYTLTGGGVAGQGVELGSKTGLGKEAGMNTDSQAIPSTDPYMDKAKTYLDQLGNYQPFKYDQNTDPAYLALSQANTANAKVANRDMEEEMNSRGILNSTVTSDRATEIYKQGADATTSAIPQLQANAFNQYQQGFNNTLNLANQYSNFSNNAFDRQVKTADETGQWKDPQVNALIQTVLDAKANYGNTGVDKQALTQAADVARGKLAQFGIKADELFGSNVTLAQAQGNVSKAFTPTMASQTNNANLITGLASQYQAIPTGTGDALYKAAPSMKDSAMYMKALEGLKTSKTISEEMKNAIDERQLKNSQASQGTAAGNLNLGWAKFNQDNLNETDKKKAIAATGLVVSKALSKDTKEEAYQYVKMHQEELDADHVNLIDVYDQINATSHWDAVKTAIDPNAPGGTLDILSRKS